MNTGQLNLASADAFVAGLAAAGLRHAVIAPGARSSPLATAFLRRAEINCEVLTDERVAGYFALGMAKASHRPCAVLCTSGTAAANLLPAVMEANLAGVPLLVLTADRPPENHHWGANQTADQMRLYGSHVRAFHALPVPDAAICDRFLHAISARLMEECVAPNAGPVHANLPFREPLLPEAVPPAPALPPPIRILHASPAFPEAPALAARLSGKPGAILCGESPLQPGFAEAIAKLAERLGAPILAEPLSGLRCGPHDRSRILTRQARFLRQPDAPDALKPAWVLRFGRFPVSRTLERWLAGLNDAEYILAPPPGLWPDPLWKSDTAIRCRPEALVEALLAESPSPAPADWFARWKQADDSAEPVGDAFFEGTIARMLIKTLPEDAHCFVGNSLAIRAMDAFGGTTAKTLTPHGNRGASGIDGNLATAAGIAAASGKPTAVLLGDQAALHDCGGLAALAGRDIIAIVMDNGGGGIFEHLPLARALPDELLERGWLAPPKIEFEHLAAAFGLRYAEAENREQLAMELERAFTAGGAHLLRVVIDREVSRAVFTD